MKLVCLIHRPNGTQVEMPGDLTVYDFQPNEVGDHVCEVTNIDHIQRLLSIPAYRVYDSDSQAQLDKIVASDNETTPVEASINLEAVTDLVKMTHEELLNEYQYRFGRAAPKLIKYETLLKKLAAARMSTETQPE